MFKGLLKNYRKKLVNLSGSNKALMLLWLSRENDLDVHETDFLLNKASFAVIENLIAGKSKFPICTLLDSRDEQSNRISRSLLKIARKDRFLFEESGACDLNIGWPFARGKFSDGTLARCPLLFFPIQLRLEENVWQIYQRKEVPVSFNKSFLLAWQHYNNLSLTEDFVETSFEGFSQDSREFRTQLYELLKNNGLEIHFNSELFIDKLEPFKEYKKADFDAENEDGRIKLFNEAVLGIFPQSGTSLVADYDLLLVQPDLEAANTEEPSLEEFFSSKSKLEQHNTQYENIKERDIQTPLPLDAPQEQALKKVKAGESIVVQGPPGTGKSQLICNLVSDFISRGKRVLVVCQKRAALDVVYKRLSSIGVGDFVALVHDFKSDRNSIYEKLAHQIEKVEEYKRSNNALDTVFVERNYLEACRTIDHSVSELEAFKKALFDTLECGISVKELYLTTQQDAPKLERVEEYYKYFTFENLLSFSNKLKYLASFALKFDSENCPWKKRRSFKNYTHSDRQKLAESLAEMHRFKESIAKYEHASSTAIHAIWHMKTILPFLLELNVASNSDKTNQSLFFLHLQKFVTASDVENKLVKWQKKLVKYKTQVLELVEKPLAKGINDENLFLIMPKIEKAIKHSKSYFGQLAWKFFAKEREDVSALLKTNSLLENKAGIEKLNERIHNSSLFFELRNELGQSKDFSFGQEDSTDAYLVNIDTIELALKYAEQWIAYSQEMSLPIKLAKSTKHEFIDDLTTLTSWVEKVETIYLSKLSYFSEEHLHDIFSRELVYQMLQMLDSEFDAMVEYDQAKDKLSFQELQALEDLVRSSEFIVPSQNKNEQRTTNEQIIACFNHNIRTRWIGHIEAKCPILRSVSTPTMAILEQDLNEAIAEKQRSSREILLLKLREQVYRNEEFNRLGNRTTFRELHHQATKKKKIWPLRKTLESFHNEAFQVLPCWLASPETVSAIFPLEQLFDLVIFDEASQCFAEKGIPSIARGKQLVIAGDSKQLQPSDLYRTRFNEDDEEIPETEIDSLLELACRYLPQVMLTEHYRSKSIDLIDFSNQHFYKRKLQLLPDFHTYQSRHKGIEFIKTDGFLENQSNVLEAERVVDLCLKLFNSHPDKEIGVITFNVHQQHMIQDLLEERSMLEKCILPESFFVKNLENVQGDEKDIVIFSIGYAPDRSGRMNHQFGSLNMDGGENRLNVAVTRAREKVIVVSSIYPQQLNVENAMHEGPKMFKKYLEYALNVSEGKFESVIHKVEVFRQEWYLKENLMKTNKLLEQEFPFADLAERDSSGVFVQLLLTDDDKFFNNLSVKETFSYFPNTLKAKNWKFERRWSRSVDQKN